MPFKSIITEPFENEHETIQFESLSENLNEMFGPCPGQHYLFGNVILDGTEVDAIFIKQDAFCLLEMKWMGGEVRFAENGPWLCDGRKIKAGRHSNPYRQVNAYRHTVRNLLNQWEKSGQLKPATEAPWGHISTFVVFGYPTEVVGQIPENIAKWFQIADLETVSEVLYQVSSSQLDLRDPDFEFFVRTFGGITPDERNRQRNLADLEKIGKLVFDRKADIGKRLEVLRVRQGPCLAVARKFEAMIGDPANWSNALDEFPSQPVDSVAGARRYQIATGHSLVVMSNRLFSCPLVIGIDYTVDQWIKDNHGITYVVDPDDRISKTYIGGKGDEKPQLIDDRPPFLERIDIDLESIVPNSFVRKGLLEINARSTGDEIDERIETVGDEAVRSLLSDIIYRIRSGDLDGANARLALYLGDSIEVEEVTGTGLKTEVNSDNFVAVADLSPAELRRILRPENFAEWMVFLHPDQHQIAVAEYQQRALLTGVSGSGKTCVLVHRARHLARKYPGQRIAILTLNRNLSHLLNKLVKALCTEEERAHISVHASYDYFKSLVDHFGPEQELANLRALGADDPEFGAEFAATLAAVDHKNFARPFDPLDSEAAQVRCWQTYLERPVVQTRLTHFIETLARHSAKIDPLAYLREEFSLIRSGCLTESREEEYLALKRSGRAIPLQPRDRQNVLNLLLLYEETMLREGALDELGLTLAVTPHMLELPSVPDHLKFRCLLIDEFQDLSTRDLAVLQRIVPSEKDALFLTGDMVQQVMVKTLSLPKVGFMRGAYDSERIYKNYRNSRQILVAANDLVLHYGQIANLQNEEITILNPQFAIRETSPPRAIAAQGPDDEISRAWEQAAQCLDKNGTKPWSISIVTASPDQISIADIIRRKPSNLGCEAQRLTGDYADHPNAINVGNMSEVKGFEFSVMIVVGCGAASLPDPGRASEEIWRDALRLYVAMTRARDEVYLLYSRSPSEILLTMDDHIEWEAEA